MRCYPARRRLFMSIVLNAGMAKTRMVHSTMSVTNSSIKVNAAL
ncbi:hypothetical protein LDG_7375 [Legionella drancourtii LLAP12]|uniref:Uncharacterized protein n=1 Tax=Legionella drancourtii LLAP12 TaxID=658187 RepID=G9EQ31_9GAMM|nr:hypothetical protein LDG_7375 [Legionella drancourtii LLAP12]